MRTGSYRNRERHVALVKLVAVGVPEDVASKALRMASRLARLAEAQCNGDWPADNGERKVAECSVCKCLWTPGSLTRAGVCQDCRAQARVVELLAPFGLYPEFAGDPRGFVVEVMVPDTAESIERSNNTTTIGLA